MTSPYLDRPLRDLGQAIEDTKAEQHIRDLPLRSKAEARRDTAKHTPGPWKISHENDGNGGFSEWFEVGPAIIRFHGDDKLAKANARLIASTPDLLTALERLVSNQHSHPKSCMCPWCQARAAIAKARNT